MITTDPVPIGAIIWALLLSSSALIFAYVLRFFYLPPALPPLKVTFLQTLGAFIGYLVINFLIVPVLFLYLAYLKTGVFSPTALLSLPTAWLLWMQIGSLASAFFYILLYLRCIDRKIALSILWGAGALPSWPLFFKNLFFGALCWFIAYPCVLFVNLLAGFISFHLRGERGVEQVAVRIMKAALDQRLVFFMLSLLVILVIPFIEEVLFRGFLQSLLKRYLGRSWGILLTAIIFSLAHFSKRQSLGNIELIPSLFVLSLFLGFLYEKRRSIFASYGLHATFNMVSIVVILLKGTA